MAKRQSTRRIDPQKLHRLIAKKLTATEIAREFGVTVSAVSHYVKRKGITLKHSARPPLDRARLRALVAAGLTCKEICAKMGWTKGAVNNICRWENLPIRRERPSVGRRS